MIETLLGAGLIAFGVILGHVLKKIIAPAPVSLDMRVGDGSIVCSSTLIDEVAEDVDDLETCDKRAVVIRNGNSLCAEHEDEYLERILGAQAPDNIEGLDEE